MRRMLGFVRVPEFAGCTEGVLRVGPEPTYNSPGFAELAMLFVGHSPGG